jgi:hypothetical protein
MYLSCLTEISPKNFGINTQIVVKFSQTLTDDSGVFFRKGIFVELWHFSFLIQFNLQDSIDMALIQFTSSILLSIAIAPPIPTSFINNGSENAIASITTANAIGELDRDAVSLSTIDNSPKVSLKANKCPNLEKSLVSPKSPLVAKLNKKFRAQNQPGQIYNFVRMGNYGAALLATSNTADRVAIKFKGNKLDKAVAISSLTNIRNRVDSVAIVLKSWGASSNNAECVQGLLIEAGL